MKDILKEFNTIVKQCEAYNSTHKTKRFLPMQQENRKGFISSIGIYDYERKKYVLTDVRAVTAEETMKEMRTFVR